MTPTPNDDAAAAWERPNITNEDYPIPARHPRLQTITLYRVASRRNDWANDTREVIVLGETGDKWVVVDPILGGHIEILDGDEWTDTDPEAEWRDGNWSADR